jgi:hypothetical protein
VERKGNPQKKQSPFAVEDLRKQILEARIVATSSWWALETISKKMTIWDIGRERHFKNYDKSLSDARNT